MDLNELFGGAAGESRIGRLGAAGSSSSRAAAGCARAGQGLLSADELFASPAAAGGSSAAGGSTRARAPAAGTGSGGGGFARRVEEEGDDSESESECSECGERDRRAQKPGARMWVASVVHPNGVCNWRDVPNCEAALRYECPCGKLCLARVGGAIQLYEYRRQLRQRAGELGQGGLRDATREVLAAQYDAAWGRFRQQFVVGNAAGVCDRAVGVAMGVSESLFAKARADVTKPDRPWHKGRKKQKVARQSAKREALDAWIRRQRQQMEGDKLTGARWHYAGKLNERELWKRYTTECDRVGQPTQGSSRLLWDLWKSHTEIQERPPTGHEVCNSCGDRAARRASLDGLTDTASCIERKEIDAEQRAHESFNKVERDHYNDAVATAEHEPKCATTLTIDAPTRHQFDLPSQARSQRDVAKRMEFTNRWQSKIEGVLDAGVGMMVYVARAGLGGGANLVCTVLMLALFCHNRLGRPLGRSLHLQLDNTTAENKNNVVFGVVGWLVWMCYFDEAVIFFMHVGHTYNDLDQTFAPLIGEMLRVVMASVEALLSFLESKLSVQRVREVRDLPHLWDFDAWIRPCLHPFKGFATTQHSSGMHEFLFKRDPDGNVRVHYRQTSQSSTWLPEGPGDLVFKSPPQGQPPIAAFKSDESWGRDRVQCNVRQWLPHLGLNIAAFSAAEESWKRVFSQIPSSAADLPAGQHLLWETLPVQVQGQHAPTMTVGARTDMIENPPVNPVETQERNHGAVARDTAVWQQAQRQAAATNALQPIFHSEYVFFKLADATANQLIALGRIVRAPFGGAIQPDDLLDITEYSHTPHIQVCGFFGTFAAKENSLYDPTAKGSVKFVRHKSVKRATVLHANVETWLDAARALRVCLKSLRVLADTLPDEYGLPATIPPLHADRDKCAAQQRVRTEQRVDAAANDANDANDDEEADNSGVHPNRQARQAAPPQPVPAKTRIAVYWESDPEGWFKGVATSHRRYEDPDVATGAIRWQTRVLYDQTDEWRNHSLWHFLDKGEEAVKWRVCDSSDEDD